MTDLPFAIAGGLCEEGIGDTVVPIEGGQLSGWIYYFQRERNGIGVTRPTKAFRANGRLFHSLNSRALLTGHGNLRSEKNDDLNLYDFHRTVVNPSLMAQTLP